ncbi:MAG: hypothetical protein AAGA08_01155 [Pseudomonadota bacterium]
MQEAVLSPREHAVKFTYQRASFVSESTVAWTLKTHHLIISPAFIVRKVISEFKDKKTGINGLWQADFTDIKVLAWLWFYISVFRDD